MDREIAAESPDAALDASRSKAQNFQFIERIGAAEGKAAAIVLHDQIDSILTGLDDDRHLRRFGMLADVIQRFSYDLQKLAGGAFFEH